MDSLTAWPSTSKITVNWTKNLPFSYTGTLVVEIWCNEDGGAFSLVKSFTNPGSRESWDHSGRSNNVTYGYKVRYTDDAGDGDYSDSLDITMWADTGSETTELSESTADQTDLGNSATETIELSEVTSDTGTISDSATETINIFDDAGDIYTLTLETDYGYYFGDFSGKIYYENEGYGADDGTAINAYWLSKETDFADIDQDALSNYKTVYKARLFYVDQTAGQSVTISVSNDGGTNWTAVGRNIGTGDNTVKSADFFFIKTGDVFQFKVNHNATTGKFQWLNLEVFYSIGGQYFEI
jgi:hypothetical protein